MDLSTSGENVTADDYRFSDDTLSVASGGLAAHYTFNGDAKDISGNGNNGTVYGAKLTSDRFGNENSAYLFDGDNDKIKVPFTESLKIEEDITINLWVNNEETGYETDFLLRSPNGYYAIQIHERNNDNNYDQVLDLMNGQCEPKKLTMENGSLVLFRGKDAIHRVTPTIGNRTRILSVLAYNSEPNVKLSETARMTFFGKLN